MMKEGVRYIAIASGPIKEKSRNSVLVGVVFRNNYIEGLVSSTIKPDGADSTDKIIRMVRHSRFKDQIRILLFNGIALAGLNVIDLDVLEKRLNSEIILLNRRRQNSKELINALNEFSRLSGQDVDGRIKIVERSSSMRPLHTDGFYLQSSMEDYYLKRFAKNAFEALRIAHIIARGVSTGESKGRL
jgi:endonuclease V-like protein UPF0215 family